MIIAHPAPPLSIFSVGHHAHTGKELPVQKTPPFIAYIGGKHPHVTVNLESNTKALARTYTPHGWVTVRWRTDYGTEDGGPVPPGPEPDISHPDTIVSFAIVSPPALPVYFRGGDTAKWVHLNGSRVPSVQTQSGSYHDTHPAGLFRMDGGLNIVVLGYSDPE